MAGLLDYGNADTGMSPQDMGLLALAAGMMQGNAGAGLMGYVNTTQGAKAQALKNQDLEQQIQLRNIALQQQQQEWGLQLPMLQAMAKRMNGGQQQQPTEATPGTPAIPAMGGGALGSGTFGINVPAQAASAPAPQQGGMSSSGAGSMFPGVPDSVAYQTAAFGGLKAVLPLLSKYNEPTEFAKTLAQGGIDPSSPRGQALIAQQIEKLNNIPLQAGRAGAPMFRPDGTIAAMAPKIPENAIPQIVNGQVVGVTPLPGAAQMAQINAFAGQAGKNQAEPMTAFSGTQPVFTNKLSAATGGVPANPFQVSAADQSQRDRDAGQLVLNNEYGGDPNRVKADIAQLTQAISQTNNPTIKSVLQGHLTTLQNAVSGAPAAPLGAPAGQLTPQLAPGVDKGQVDSQSILTQRWPQLLQSNTDAQNTTSYLQNIKALAPTAATGPFTNKLQFANALLATVGNEKAQDATTANALLDKYSNQIVARLGGSGGLATDSARAILQAGYPNAHMTKEAIAEAADNLIGAQSMIQAKTRLLQGDATARNPAAYSQKEVQFDQNADPRIWQLKSMDPQTAQKWLAQFPANVQADLRQRVKNLQAIGAL